MRVRLGMWMFTSALLGCGGGDSPSVLIGGDLEDPTMNGGENPSLSGGGGNGGGERAASDRDASVAQLDASVETDGSRPLVDAGATSGNVFAGAPAYQAHTGSKVPSKSAHGGRTPEGLKCLDCHSSWTMAGTIYAANGTTGAEGVEIRTIDSGGTPRVTYSDINGNFYLKSGKLAAPGHTGIRNASVVRNMVARLEGKDSPGNCNSCHDGSEAPRIHL